MTKRLHISGDNAMKTALIGTLVSVPVLSDSGISKTNMAHHRRSKTLLETLGIQYRSTVFSDSEQIEVLSAHNRWETESLEVFDEGSLDCWTDFSDEIEDIRAKGYWVRHTDRRTRVRKQAFTVRAYPVLFQIIGASVVNSSGYLDFLFPDELVLRTYWVYSSEYIL